MSDIHETALPLLNDDLTQLRSILTVLGLKIGCLREEDTHTLALTAPLYRPCGSRYGWLGIPGAPDVVRDGLRMAIEALVSFAARSISERWFRLHHRESWILAATPATQSGSAVLLALDQHLVLKGMDFHAIEYLGYRLTLESPSWKDFFQPIKPLPTLRLRADIPVQLIGTRHGDQWTGLLTPPLIDARRRWTGDALLHARPRCHGLADLATLAPSAPCELPALTGWRRKKGEEFIEANLELPLPVERLAKEAGISASHFSRAFRNAFRMTPHRYVMWRRLQRARELIENTDAGLAEIAMAAGFSDQSHLSRLFQLNMGESPREFRRHCR